MGSVRKFRPCLHEQPFSGHVFVFRGRRGDIIKLLWCDGDGLCLFAKRLERGRFIWPQAKNGTVRLSRAQLSMLLEGIDWRRVQRTWAPEVGGVMIMHDSPVFIRVFYGYISTHVMAYCIHGSLPHCQIWMRSIAMLCSL